LKPLPRHEVWFAVLGPVRAWRGETEIDLGPPLRRALLALLLVQARRPVAIADIVKAMWGQDPPATAVNQVHGHVGTLRRLIEPGLPPRSAGRWLLRSAGGYRLDADAESLDLLLHRQLWHQARQVAAGRPDQAVQLAMQALELWHGPAAGGVDWPAGGPPAVTALDREYLVAAREVADLALLAGVPGRVLTIVQQAAARVPFDEPVQARLVRVLAATGARAEALNVYRTVATLLAEELGIDPGPELRAAQTFVLRAEPEPGKAKPPAATGVTQPAYPQPADSGRSVMGEDRAGLDNAPMVRTGVRVVPTAVLLAGDPQTLRLLAGVIDIALDDLGDGEWQARTGTHCEQARAFAARLRDVVRAANASWHQLDATADELATARSALVELAHGTTRVVPPGSSRLDIVDLLEELDRQLGR